MKKCADKLEKDSKHYSKEMKHAKGKKKEHERIEMKESKSAAKDLRKRARSAHEY